MKFNYRGLPLDASMLQSEKKDEGNACEPNDIIFFWFIWGCVFFIPKWIKVDCRYYFEFSSFPIVIMTTSIKLFQFFQKFYEIIGIHSAQANFKLSKTTCLIFLQMFTVTTVAYLVFDAKSMLDYGFGFFSLIYSINFNVMYLIFIWEFENTTKFIARCEEFIAKSEYLHSEFK